MRIFVAVIVWVIFIGGLSQYMKHRDFADYSPNNLFEFQQVEKVYALEVTPSFILESDPFALMMDIQNSSPALLIRLGEHELLNISAPLTTVETFKIDPLHSLIAGQNEIYVEATPPTNHFSTYNALRIRILKNGYPFEEKTLWSPPGTKVAGTFQFTLETDNNDFSEEKHDHD
jgi:hypothetical protein